MDGLDYKRYSTGKPCKNGHISERRVTDNRCVQCLKDTRARAPIEHKKNKQKRNKRWLESTREIRQERAKKLQADNKLKRCVKCGIDKDISEFLPNNRQRDGLRNDCKDCVNERRRETGMVRRAAPAAKELRKGHWLKHRYGITLEDFNTMLKNQGDRCAICGTDKPGGMGGFVVDHDHNTGKVRGLLCMTCNIKLGVVEAIKFIELARVYLAHYGVMQ